MFGIWSKGSLMYVCVYRFTSIKIQAHSLFNSTCHSKIKNELKGKSISSFNLLTYSFPWIFNELLCNLTTSQPNRLKVRIVNSTKGRNHVEWRNLHWILKSPLRKEKQCKDAILSVWRWWRIDTHSLDEFKWIIICVV